MRKSLAILFVAGLLLGCTSKYNPEVIQQLSQKNQQVTVLAPSVCDDLYVGAQAFQEGPERAWAWLGRAREIDAAHVTMTKQGVVCDNAIDRGLMNELADRLLEAFKRTWREAEGVVK